MPPTVDYAALAPLLLDKVGGEANVRSMSHCATRLRFVLADESKATTAGIKALPGVVTVVQAGGQYQVVIGNDVPIIYEELGKISKLGGEAQQDDVPATGNLLDRFIQLISSIFQPILWPLAGTGLFKAFLALFVTVGWLDDTSDGYTVLYAAADSFMTFLPIVLAVPAAKRFRANPFTAMAIAGALVYPSIISMNDGASHAFFGIPLTIMSYVSSVVPIIVAVWVQGHLERFFNKYIPGALRNFMTPWLTLLIMVPLTLLTIGPVTTMAANGLASGVQWVFDTAPWLGGAIMGGFWQVFVMFGLHWGLVPVMTQEITSNGYSLMIGPLLAAVLAQAASCLAVMLRSKDAKTKELAGPAALSGFLAGITEPAIYGVNLPRKYPFYFGIVGGAIGGVLSGLAGARVEQAGVFPSLIGAPAWLPTPNIPLLVIGVLVAIGIAFALTFFWGVRDDDIAVTPPVGASAPDTALVTPTRSLGSPVTGTATPLENVADPVFSSGALGNGVGVVPFSGTIMAPAAGEVVTALDTGHAYGIKTDDGVEVLVHVGLDTVKLAGRGFSPRVEVGARVTRGQVLAEVDLDLLRAEGYDPTTVLVVTNTASLTAVVPVVDGAVSADDDVIEIDH